MKVESSLVTFTEVPDEISLCLNISGCPCHCPGCFEPWLADDIGEPLLLTKLYQLINAAPHITCVCFLGGDRYYDQLIALIQTARQNYPRLKWAFYSGRDIMYAPLAVLLDYYKVGPYQASAGPLNSPITNQRFYCKINNQWYDYTYKFQTKRD